MLAAGFVDAHRAEPTRVSPFAHLPGKKRLGSGSQLTDPAPMMDALARVLALVDELQAHGVHIEHLDMGGGLGDLLGG